MLFHDVAAHTDGDSIVYLRKSDVIVAGDVFVTTAGFIEAVYKDLLNPKGKPVVR